MLKKILKSYDYSLILAIVLLSVFGLIMVYSASMASAVQRYGVASDYFYQKQKLFLIGAAFTFVVAALFPYKAMKSNKVLGPMVFLSLIVLAGLFIFGKIRGGAQSWFVLGPISLQPSEFVKLCVIIYLAAVYAKKQPYINEFNKGVAPPLVYLLLVCGLIAIQPDFGTAFIIALIAATIILCSGMNMKNFVKLAIILIIILVPLVLALKGDIFTTRRTDRFEVLKNPFAFEQTSGYHLANSYIAIGSGGVNGLGLGHGIEKLGYLPESHTDFIIAVIAEELGVWGVGFVILTLAFIVLKGIYIGLQCKDPFGSLLAIGVSGMIGIQSFVNLAGVSGVIPLAGVPLPFVSYGGSSIIQLSIATGILVNVSMFVNFERKDKQGHLKIVNKHANDVVKIHS